MLVCRKRNVTGVEGKTISDGPYFTCLSLYTRSRYRILTLNSLENEKTHKSIFMNKSCLYQTNDVENDLSTIYKRYLIIKKHGPSDTSNIMAVRSGHVSEHSLDTF